MKDPASAAGGGPAAAETTATRGRVGDDEAPTVPPRRQALPSNRFALELEFVQCLASPAYLHHLATTKVLSDPSFLSFLRYLRYWKRPEYARYITFPHCLFFLDLIMEPRFRREMSEVRFRDFVHQQQFLAWQYRGRELYGAGAGQLTETSEDNDGSGAQAEKV
mmetsp:Transcript_7542/g.15649  ORF Transcript_7542/g.15649 Transcript_7542/m.15649 type:complete len:164 (+) Transcript_7542:228-719(+)